MMQTPQKVFRFGEFPDQAYASVGYPMCDYTHYVSSLERASFTPDEQPQSTSSAYYSCPTSCWPSSPSIATLPVAHFGTYRSAAPFNSIRPCSSPSDCGASTEANGTIDTIDEKETPNATHMHAGRDERGGPRNKPLPDSAIRILKKWYDTHKNQPYPHENEKRKLAVECNLKLQQVTSWFANKRNRTGNTRNKKRRSQLITDLNAVYADLTQERMRLRTQLNQAHCSQTPFMLQVLGQLDLTFETSCSKINDVIVKLTEDTKAEKKEDAKKRVR